MLNHSGHPVGGMAVFAEPFGWDSSSCCEPYAAKPELEYIHKEPNADALSYLARVWATVAHSIHGLAAGNRELAVRSTAIPGTRKAQTWIMRNVPESGRPTMLRRQRRRPVSETPLLRDAHNTTDEGAAGISGHCPGTRRSSPASRPQEATRSLSPAQRMPTAGKSRVPSRRGPRSTSPPASAPPKRAATPNGEKAGESEKEPAMAETTKEAHRVDPGKKDEHNATDEKTRKLEKYKRALRDLSLVNVKGDGSCLWRSVHDALQARGYVEPGADVRRTKQLIILHMRSERKSYEPVWDGREPTSTGTLIEKRDFSEYIKRLARGGSWGSNLEVKAASKHFGVPIIVVCEESKEFYAHGRESGKRPLM